MIRRDIQKDTVGAAARPSGLPDALKLDHVKIPKINVAFTQPGNPDRVWRQSRQI